MGRIALFDIGYLLLFSNLVTESFSKGQRQHCGTKPDSPDFPELKIKVTVSATMLCFLCFHFSQKHPMPPRWDWPIQSGWYCTLPAEQMKTFPAPASQDTAGKHDRNVGFAELCKNRVQRHRTKKKMLFWQDWFACMEGQSAWAHEKSWPMKTLYFSSMSILVQALLNCPTPTKCYYQRWRTRRHAGKPFARDELPEQHMLSLLWPTGRAPVLGRRS